MSRACRSISSNSSAKTSSEMGRSRIAERMSAQTPRSRFFRPDGLRTARHGICHSRAAVATDAKGRLTVDFHEGFRNGLVHAAQARDKATCQNGDGQHSVRSFLSCRQCGCLPHRVPLAVFPEHDLNKSDTFWKKATLSRWRELGSQTPPAERVA